MERTAGNQLMIKENNQKFIIDTLIDRGATSRADLAKLLKLSAPSVSNNINQLLQKKLLLEIGEGDSAGGRRPILLDFNYRYGYIIGVDLSGQDLKIALSDLKPEIMELRKFDISNEKSGRKILDIIIETIVALFAKHQLNLKQLLTIVVGFPGVVNEATGRMALLPLWVYVWDEINLHEELQKKFKSKVIIKNDINLAALGESRYGLGREYHNLVYVSIDRGVGAGVVIDNRLYEGTRRAAGEIGYLASDATDVAFDHQNFGPLESRVGLPGLIRKIREDLRAGCDSRIRDLAQGDPERVDLRVIKAAVSLEDPYILGEMVRIQNQLAVIMANIGILLDLELVLLGGQLTSLGYDFLKPLNEMVGKLVPLGTKVVYSSLEQPVLYGAFAAALEYVQSNILSLK